MQRGDVVTAPLSRYSVFIMVCLLGDTKKAISHIFIPTMRDEVATQPPLTAEWFLTCVSIIRCYISVVIFRPHYQPCVCSGPDTWTNLVSNIKCHDRQSVYICENHIIPPSRSAGKKVNSCKLKLLASIYLYYTIFYIKSQKKLDI